MRMLPLFVDTVEVSGSDLNFKSPKALNNGLMASLPPSWVKVNVDASYSILNQKAVSSIISRDKIG